jgi:WD40 repeat protein
VLGRVTKIYQAANGRPDLHLQDDDGPEQWFAWIGQSHQLKGGYNKPMLLVLWRIVNWPLRFLFGRDVFISYARADGDAYVRKLAERLRNAKPRAISYFLDLHVATADPVIPPAALRHARWCRVLVLVTSEAAIRSGSGAMLEVAEFVKRPKRLFIPIDVDGAYVKRDRSALPWNLIGGAAPERETAVAVKEGVVSPSVVERIESLVGNNRFERRLTWASVVALCLIVIGVVFFFRARIAQVDARANRLTTAATSAMTRDYSLALLLAAEALDIRPDLPFTRSAILEVLIRHGGLITILHPASPSTDVLLPTDVSALAVSPDGWTLASGQSIGIVRLWNLGTKSELLPPIEVDGRVLNLSFDRSGARLLISTIGGQVIVRDLRTRQQASFHGGPFATFRPDGGIATLNDERLFDPTTNETLLPVSPGTLSFVFSRDGTYLVTGDAKGQLQVFDWKRRKLFAGAAPPMVANECNRPIGYGAAIWWIVASPTDPTLFAASDRNGNIIMFHPGQAEVHRTSERSEPSLSFSPDGTYLSATIDNGLMVYRAPDLQIAGRFSYADQPLCTAFAHGNAVLTGNRDSTITLFSLGAMDPLGPARTMESRASNRMGNMKRAAFTPTGDEVGVSDERGQLKTVVLRPSRKVEQALLPYVRRKGFIELQDAISRKTVRSIVLASGAQAFDAALSADGRRLAALVDREGKRTLAIYDVEPGRLLKEFGLENQKIKTVAIDAHGERIATGDLPHGNVIVKSVARGTELAHFVSEEQINAIAFSPDSRTLVASDLGATYIYSLDPPLLLGSRSISAACLEFSPDGKTMAVCEPDGLRLWIMSSAAWRDLARRIAGRKLTPLESTQYGARDAL